MATMFRHTAYCYEPKGTVKGYFGWAITRGGEGCVELLHRT